MTALRPVMALLQFWNYLRLEKRVTNPGRERGVSCFPRICLNHRCLVVVKILWLKIRKKLWSLLHIKNRNFSSPTEKELKLGHRKLIDLEHLVEECIIKCLRLGRSF